MENYSYNKQTRVDSVKHSTILTHTEAKRIYHFLIVLISYGKVRDLLSVYSEGDYFIDSSDNF